MFYPKATGPNIKNTSQEFRHICLVGSSRHFLKFRANLKTGMKYVYSHVLPSTSEEREGNMTGTL